MEHELRVAQQALRDAAGVCQVVQANLVATSTLEKADRTPVTVADLASQAIVCRALALAFPSDPIVAEESATILDHPDLRATGEQVVAHVRSLDANATYDDVVRWIDHSGTRPGDRFWTLDPIDGTKGFLRRGHYAVALALLEAGRVVLAALACPELAVDPLNPERGRGILCYALRGRGAWLETLVGRDPAIPLHTDGVRDLRAARFVESVESAHTDQETHGRIAELLGIERAPLRMDSQAKYAAIARGEASIYLRLPSPDTPGYRERIWDHAAGALLVEEAGGVVSDACGRALDFSRGARLQRNSGVVATSGPGHAAVIRACLRVQGSD